ncbi:MAG: cysteine desulfurase [Lachnospiraceae bacterium]|nr:cysteine desulfurase [Lachnospiraceae bacterium]
MQKTDYIYFDNAATTEPCEAAVSSFLKAAACFGNPSSAHFLGREAAALLETAREQLASAIGADSSEIIFTSGGTEANNLAIQGTCEANSSANEIIISAVEHPSVFRVCRILRKKGWHITKIDCGLDGSFDKKALKEAVSDRTALVSFMTVNNETGTVFPIPEITLTVKNINPHTLVHTDAVQAFGKTDLSVRASGIDLMSLSAHKIHGLKGAGALYVKKGTPIYPIEFGGDQESGMRSGTEALPAICAFGTATEIAVKNIRHSYDDTKKMRQIILTGLRKFENVVINSAPDNFPYILNFSVKGKKADEILLAFSDRGICISKGAACKANHAHGPSMLMSFGIDTDLADNALRLSFCENNTPEEAERFLRAANDIIHRQSPA